MKKFTKDTTLAEVLGLPGAKRILVKYNLPCLGCPMAKWEMADLKIGEICRIYGINLKDLLNELNKKVKK